MFQFIHAKLHGHYFDIKLMEIMVLQYISCIMCGCMTTNNCMTKREQLCFTRAIVLKGSGRICQLHVFLDNNLSTLVTSRLLS